MNTSMKYHTIGTSNFFTEGKNSKFAVYADTDLAREKMNSYEAEMTSVRGQLELVQKALKQQTRRCRQLVAEYTKRFQLKEQEYQTEKHFRDDQLATVLRALLVLEARLRQEQKYISHQLKEKDFTIKKQQTDIQRLLTNTYCKNCNQYYSESLDSSSEYVVTDYHSSTFESLDSGSDTYASVTEKECTPGKIFNNCNMSVSSEDSIKLNSSMVRNMFIKNKHNESLSRRTKRIIARNSVGEYSDVLKKIENEESNNDYDEVNSPLDSKPKSSSSSEMSPSETSSNVTTCATALNITTTSDTLNKSFARVTHLNNVDTTVTVFEGDIESNDNWYTSTSDQEDDDQRGIYRNNPVLECMNQILLQNINDPLVSPPKSPDIDKKSTKNKRVSFEEMNVSNLSSSGYYETPIQKTPNFYETPQSTYSNDYEQILSQFEGSSGNKNGQRVDVNVSPRDFPKKQQINFVNDKSEIPIAVVRKSKILRTPPALPPKPSNLIIARNIPSPSASTKLSDKSCDSEPDYCSISEINLPTTDKLSFMKINVVAEINSPKTPENISPPHFNQNEVNGVGETVLNKTSSKSKTGQINNSPEKSSPSIKQTSTPTKLIHDIPKLPQVTEIIIPDENESLSETVSITPDNYIENNTQSLKHKVAAQDRTRIHPIQMGSTVSSLIASFNKKQILSEMQSKPKIRERIDKRLFSSFENLQAIDLQQSPKFNNEKFDLSQNFEEFNLDDCEISEYTDGILERNITPPEFTKFIDKKKYAEKPLKSSTCVELVRATKDSTSTPFNTSPLQQLKKKLEEKIKMGVQKTVNSNEPTYEHFLECTGLSSKAIMTPSRLVNNPRMLKLKEVKLRSKTKSTIFQKQNGSIKYWSEPFL